MGKPSNIPQSVWDGAAEIAAQFDTDWTSDGSSDGTYELQNAIELIAVAIMAEAEVCAGLADCDCEAAYCEHREKADAIRKRNEP